MRPFINILLKLFFIAYLIAPIQSFSQSNEIDSLKGVLEKYVSKDTSRVNVLYSLAFASFNIDETATRTYLDEVRHLSDSLDYTLGKAKLNYLEGILQNRRSNIAESIKLFEKSLEHYQSINDEKGIAAVYSAFGITHYSLSENEKALENYKKASLIYEKNSNERELINTLINVGNVYTNLGRYDEAIENYKKALFRCEKSNKEASKSSVYTSLGAVYRYQGNYPLAIAYYTKSLAYNQKIHDTLRIAKNLSNLGDAYTASDNYDKGLEYSLESLKYSKKIGNRSLTNNITILLGNIYMNKHQYEKSLQYYYESLKISEEINHIDQKAMSLYNIGEIYLILKKPLIAREKFIEARDTGNEIDYKRLLSYSLLGIAESYILESAYQTALPYALEGKAYALELNMLEPQKKAEELLSFIYEHTGDYQNALESHQLYKTLNDSLFNKENIQKITQLEYEYKYKNQLENAKNNELRLTETVKVTSSNLEKTQGNLLLGIIIFLLVTIILGIIIFYLRVRNVKSETQNIITEQRLLRSQMTPHFIFNALSVLQGIILNKENKKAVSYLSKFSKLLRVTLENSRDQMVALNQELIAIENYISLQNIEVETPYNYSLMVDANIDKDQFYIPPMLIQPFIENAIEHGFINHKGEKEITIILNYTNKVLTCTIKDNGIGIEAQKINSNQNKKSLSTAITTERLELLSRNTKHKGSIRIDDRKKYDEQGTQVTLIIPYRIEVPQ
ncbi:MAG: tetratricopeptide repeat protein [Flavobacteriales bacterium]|jgi:tetratricopeptide (TPR) repeat protein|nr:tetratricopeptide repeat protein [Flavobacteriales bacterium]